MLQGFPGLSLVGGQIGKKLLKERDSWESGFLEEVNESASMSLRL